MISFVIGGRGSSLKKEAHLSASSSSLFPETRYNPGIILSLLIFKKQHL
jgi:hypothetical protein